MLPQCKWWYWGGGGGGEGAGLSCYLIQVLLLSSTMIFIILSLSPIKFGVDYLHTNIEGKECQTRKSNKKNSFAKDFVYFYSSI